MALFVRLTASGVQETMNSTFIRFARAKGLSVRRILFVYVLRNILVPVITVIGIVFGVLLAFAVVTETIFSWPGTGRLIIDSIRSSDRPVVIAYLMFTVTIFIVVNFTVDIVCAVIDPRISLMGGK
jgi:peptide/nickel transport system permease protein